MRQNPPDDELLRSYLLGELTEDERDRVEERLLLEDELFELSEAVEADLLAASDRGELAPAERERVLRRLASSPQGRERLALARALNREARPAPAVVPFPRRDAAPSRHTVRWAALAAALVAAAGLSWYTLEQQRHGGESAPIVVQVPPAPANPVNPAAPKPPSPEPPQAVARTAPEPSRVVLQLALLGLRGGESAERLEIPTGTDLVELRLSGDELAGYESFDVALRDEEGDTVWEKSGIRPRKLASGPVLVAEIPSGRLADGRYEIQTRGLTPGSGPEELSPQEIQVVRRGRG